MWVLLPMAVYKTTIIGEIIMSTLAFMAEVMLKPLKKANILSATPKNAHTAKSKKSRLFSIFSRSTQK